MMMMMMMIENMWRGCGTPRRTSLAFLYNRNQLIDPLRMWPIVARNGEK